MVTSMQHCYADLNNTIDNNQKIILKEFISILKDKEWHRIYEFHDRFRISPLQFVQSIRILKEYKLIDMKDTSIRLSLSIDNNSFLILNRMMKTDSPEIINIAQL
jgi:hypothetical protein